MTSILLMLEDAFMIKHIVYLICCLRNGGMHLIISHTSAFTATPRMVV
ncbi:hypothetical protein C3B55_00979 [Candidatus Pseudomonas adelgestsugas]|uniref:Uncharacterized protein n=1 Tax=Candidatus Pseudomonas adelgestsugas TaxID=1302376 RepID=A0ABX5RAS0_9PSED|nr:hypothetical protein C3B55_00979 [Candidatus Pseudomonas adelgestsugas]